MAIHADVKPARDAVIGERCMCSIGCTAFGHVAAGAIDVASAVATWKRMLTKTSLSGIRALLTLAGARDDTRWTPQRLAGQLGESPSYLTKVVGHLVHAGILRSERGAKGGVRLTRPVAGITLLQIVEACQGAVMGDYCRSASARRPPCAFHQAAAELHDAILQVLGRWTLADLLASPFSGNPECLMGAVGKPRLVQLAKRTKP